MFLKCHAKKRKSVESVIHVFTLLHFAIVNRHFRCKTITHNVMLYIQHYIKIVYF